MISMKLNNGMSVEIVFKLQMIWNTVIIACYVQSETLLDKAEANNYHVRYIRKQLKNVTSY